MARIAGRRRMGPGSGRDEGFSLAAKRLFNPEMRPSMPHTGMSLFPGQRSEYLSKLLAGDPALSLYDLSTVKKYSEQPDPYLKKVMPLSARGYYDDGLSYVKDIEKLGTYPGKSGESWGDKTLATVAGHELTHGLLLKYGIDIDLPETRQGSGWGIDRHGNKVYIGKTHEKNEILNLLLDIQKGDTSGKPQMELQSSPYSISKHPSGEYGFEGLMSALGPYAEEFYSKVEEDKDEDMKRKIIMDRRATKKGLAQVAMQKRIQEAEAAKQQAPLRAAGAYSPQVQQDPGGGGTWHQQTRAKEKAGVQVAGPGFGKGAYFADGGMVDKTLSGRSRDI